MSINPLLKHGFWRVFYIRRGVSATIIDSAEAVPFLRVIHPFGVTLPMNEAGLMKPRLTLQDFDWCIFHEDITTKLFIVYICPYAIVPKGCLHIDQHIHTVWGWVKTYDYQMTGGITNHFPQLWLCQAATDNTDDRWKLSHGFFLLCLGCA